MRPSLHYGMRGDDPAATIALLADADIWDLVCDSKQIARRQDGGPLTAEEVAAFRRPFDEAGIRLSAVTVGWMKRGADGRPPEEDLRAVCASIAALGEGGVPVAQLFDMGAVPEDADRDRYVAGLHDSYRPIVQACAAAGVLLAIHASWLPQTALWNTETLLALFEAVPDAHNGVCFCAGSYWQAGDDVVESVRRLGQRIHYVHLRDADVVGANCPEILLGKGKVPFAALARALREIGFDGPINCEHFGTFRNQQHGELNAVWAAGFLRGLLQER